MAHGLDVFSDRGREQLRSFLETDPLLAFDLDGTLVPVLPDRAAVQLGSTTQRKLQELGRLTPLAVLSGRPLDFIESRVGSLFRWKVGNHGMEWNPELPQAGRWRELCHEWRETLAKEALPPGTDIEDKNLSLSVHYRRCANPAQAAEVLSARLARLPSAHLVGGKMVWNVIPDGAPDKGVAAVELLRRSEASSLLYIGDDVTDEAVFKRTDFPLLGIYVGESTSTAAKLVVPRQEQVDAFLSLCCEILAF